jgi:hypothetical protein
VADKLFGEWVTTTNSAPASTAPTPQRKTSGLATSVSQPLDDTTTTQSRFMSEPTEVILRGYRSLQHQYAAINHYEQLAGRICEDYSREPPIEQRRYKSDLRDPAFTRRKPLTPEERAKVNRADGGEHWVKVTFESAEDADKAMYASPQRVLGYLVYAEPYRGLPPAKDEPIPDVDSLDLDDHSRSRPVPAVGISSSFSEARSRGMRHNHLADSMGRSTSRSFGREGDLSPPDSRTSSQTMETATMSTSAISTALSSGTVTDAPPSSSAGLISDEDSIFCRRIPTARKVKLLPAEQALLPQQSYTQRVVNRVPFLKWFSGSMIGNEVPRTDLGEFDWNRASLYWKIIWWLDNTFRLFGGEILNADKDD